MINKGRVIEGVLQQQVIGIARPFLVNTHDRIAIKINFGWNWGRDPAGDTFAIFQSALRTGNLTGLPP